jgi:hypothetical protein
LGIQRRGAYHLHLLLFTPSSFGSLKELRHFISVSWWDICGRVSEGHLRAGAYVDELRTWRRVSYVARYMGKKETFPEGLRTGRCWGAWNQDLLPVRWKTIRVSIRDAFKIRRIFRRLAGKRGTGSLCTLTVFVSYETLLRLLEFLGYRHE